jgi:hypothetical protein
MLTSLAACSRQQSASSTTKLQWKFNEGESLVYKYQVEQNHTSTSDKKSEKKTEEGKVLLDCTKKGHSRLSFDPERLFDLPESQLELSSNKNSMFFPIPPFPLSKSPKTHRWVIKGLGGASNVADPDYKITETVRLVDSNIEQAQVSWSRDIEVVMPKSMKMIKTKQSIKVTGKGTFDLKEGRYTKISLFENIKYKMDFGEGRTESGTIEASTKLDLDKDLSQKRTEFRRGSLKASVEAKKSFADYVQNHPAEKEIDAAIDELLKRDVPVGTPVFSFHVHAHPEKVWQAGLAKHRTDKEKKTFVRAMSVQQIAPSMMPDEVIGFFKTHVMDEPALYHYISGLADARLESTLKAMSKMEDQSVAQRARKTLDKLSQGKNPQNLMKFAADQSFIALGHTIILGGGDMKQLVDVLIQVLANEAADKINRQVCVQWLEGITRRALGDDVAAWRTFWKKNRDRQFRDWLVDATRNENQLMKLSALQGLGDLPPFEKGLDVLLESLMSTVPRVRLTAAAALASWDDGRALNVLIDFLKHPMEEYRRTAFVQLASFHKTTLGFQPGGKEEDRAAAIGRWEGWASQAKLPRVDSKD